MSLPPWSSRASPALLAAVLCANGCARPAPAPEGGWHPVPADDPAGATCRDVGPVRACWGEDGADSCSGGACLRDAPRPPREPSAAGWRCVGEGGARRCVDRAREASAFRCEGGVCTQRHPRLPDDGQWECVDLDGAVVCRAIGDAAGIVPGPPDPGFDCGPRAGAGERICVDLSPDVPAAGGRCRFEHTAGEQRVCGPPGRPALGGPCGDGGACPTGAVCAGGRCLPRQPPRPSCWLDADCGGACRFGSCEVGS